MKVYMDMCALKRPFDDQSDSRVWIESQAVIRILHLSQSSGLAMLGSEALVLENGQNPNVVRRLRVET